MTCPPAKPNYDNLRDERKFAWSAGGIQSTMHLLAGISFGEFNLSAPAGVEAYRKGPKIFREMFGDSATASGPSTPAVSYGHVNCRGLKLIFPDDGDVNYERPTWSVDELIEILKSDVDFASAGMQPLFLDYRRVLQEAFPDQKVGYGFGREGPMTTVYTLLDAAAFTEPYDEPERFATLMDLIVDDIVAYMHFLGRLDGRPEINPDGTGMCDDIGSFFDPKDWARLTIPYWERYYRGVTTGARSAHIEDLRPEQVSLLEEIGLSSFDPSISARLSPKIVRDNCRIPFAWRLASFHYPLLTCDDVKDFVYKAVADGASRVHTTVEPPMCNEETIPKVAAFAAAARDVEQMFKKGATRADIEAKVSDAGRKRSWDNWPA